MSSSTRNDSGAALVELPAAFLAFCIFALCITALGQIFVEYHHVSGAARAAARFATKSDYDPTQQPATAARRPTDDAVVAFAKQAAAPLPPADVAVALTPDDVAGAGVTVDVRHTVDSGPFALVVSTADRLLDLIGADPLPPVTVHATSTAIYE